MVFSSLAKLSVGVPSIVLFLLKWVIPSAFWPFPNVLSSAHLSSSSTRVHLPPKAVE